MKRILLLALIYICPINAQFNPCYDDLYLSLKAKGLNALSTREYHYFTRKMRNVQSTTFLTKNIMINYMRCRKKYIE